MQQAQQKTTLFVAIDGYAGAGKSTLATWLCEQLPQCQIIRLDDFYRPLSKLQQQLQCAKAVQAYFPAAYVVDQVLQPLHNGDSASWHALDWLTQTLLPAKTIHPHGVILLEGVFSTIGELQPWLDCSVMVSVSSKIRHQRVIARPQPSTDWWRHWQATEDWFHKRYDTLRQVDWVLAGDSDGCANTT